MVNLALVIRELEESTRGRRSVRLGSMAPGAPPLFVSRKSNVYYVNGAKVCLKNEIQENEWSLLTQMTEYFFVVV